MKGIEIPPLDFSLLIFTVPKRIFAQIFFNFICLNLKRTFDFSPLERSIPVRLEGLV